MPRLDRPTRLPLGDPPRYNTPQMAHKQIRFGTSGWRGIIAEDFTFDNVRTAVAAIADYVRQQNPRNPRVIVGYDTRFFSDEFARTAVEVLSARQVHCFLCQQPTPTPTIAYEICRRKVDGGINFTASHNPPEYNGLKFSTPDGAPALPEVTRQLEQLAEKHASGQAPAPPAAQPRSHEEIDPRPPYLEALAEKIAVEEIKRASLKVVYDPLYGTGAGYLDRFLADHGIEVQTLHGHRDVLFGGHAPEPSDEILHSLREAVKAHSAHRSEERRVGKECRL